MGGKVDIGRRGVLPGPWSSVCGSRRGVPPEVRALSAIGHSITILDVSRAVLSCSQFSFSTTYATAAMAIYMHTYSFDL